MKNTKVKKTVHTSNKDKNKKKRKEFNMNNPWELLFSWDYYYGSAESTEESEDNES